MLLPPKSANDSIGCDFRIGLIVANTSDVSLMRYDCRWIDVTKTIFEKFAIYTGIHLLNHTICVTHLGSLFVWASDGYIAI